MAHQAHNIPWNVLASNVEWKASNHCLDGATSFHLRFQQKQDKEINYFVNAFVRNIHAHATGERRKYPVEYEIPSRDDVVLNDDVARKINPTVRTMPTSAGGFCDHPNNIFCSCTLPPQERRMSAFLRKHESNDCYHFFDVNSEAFFNLGVVKALLLYGEMEPILRVCAHPEIDLSSWWEQMQCQCLGEDLGWEHICQLALDAHICLNLIYCFPETWNSPDFLSKDYRHTHLYQRLIRNCTGFGRTCDLATHPHRQFFGIEENQFKDWPRTPRLRDPVRLRKLNHKSLPYEEFLASEKLVDTWQPTKEEVVEVRDALFSLKLPMEIVDEILERASYSHTHRLPVSHHPFHPDNREELAKYLKYCWQLVVRCEILGRALGMEIAWSEMVGRSLRKVLRCGCRLPRWWNWEFEDRGNNSSHV